MSEINYEILIDDSNQYVIELNEQGPQGNTGPQGPQGPQGETGTAATITVGTVTTGNPGTNVSVVNSGTSSNAIFDFIIPRGDKGENGSGITSITKTGTAGLVDTYTITFDNGDTTTFTVTNGAQGDAGRGITSITKTGISGLIDTYTITYSDNTTSTFTVTNGQNGTNGEDGFSPIATVTKSGDTATISITDANGTTTATITDGADGSSEWGTITGNISSQTDLSNALDNKVNIDLSNLSNTGKDYINQSKALETGSVSTNADVYAWIKSMKDNSFDVANYKIYGSPTITDNGIASGFTLGNFIEIQKSIDVTSTDYEIRIPFKASNVNNAQCLLGRGATASNFSVIIAGSKVMLFLGTGSSWDIANGATGITTLSANINYTIKFIRTSGNYIVKLVNESTKEETTEITISSQTDIGALSNFYIGEAGYWGYAEYCEFDLKHFYIEENGTPIFSGHRTGSDVVTINNSNITIPYIVSKTGSKIADVAYRTNIQNLYEQEGLAEYFTLDETNQNFTLPMGEIYGMISRSNFTPTEKYIDLALGAAGSTYIMPADGYLYFAKKTVTAYESGGMAVMDSSYNGVDPEDHKIYCVEGYHRADGTVQIILPVYKNAKVYVNWSLQGETKFFRFVYAKSGESEV